MPTLTFESFCLETIIFYLYLKSCKIWWPYEEAEWEAQCLYCTLLWLHAGVKGQPWALTVSQWLEVGRKQRLSPSRGPTLFPTHSLPSRHTATLSNRLLLTIATLLLLSPIISTLKFCFWSKFMLTQQEPFCEFGHWKKTPKIQKNPHDHLCQGMDSLILEVSPILSTPSAFRHSIFVLGVTCRSVHKTPGTMCVFPSRRRSKEALPCWPLCTSCIWLPLTGMRLGEERGGLRGR